MMTGFSFALTPIPGQVICALSFRFLLKILNFPIRLQIMCVDVDSEPLLECSMNFRPRNIMHKKYQSNICVVNQASDTRNGWTHMLTT